MPRTVVAAIVVAIVAFLAGVALSGGGTSAPSIGLPSVSPPPASIASRPTASSGRSARSPFADRFDPGALIKGQSGGKDCITEDTVGPNSAIPETSPAFIRTWLSTCPQSGLGTNVETNLFQTFSGAIPNASGTNLGPDATGMSLFQFTYRDGAFTGTVTVASAGENNERILAITLAEAPILAP